MRIGIDDLTDVWNNLVLVVLSRTPRLIFYGASGRHPRPTSAHGSVRYIYICRSCLLAPLTVVHMESDNALQERHFFA